MRNKIILTTLIFFFLLNGISIAEYTNTPILLQIINDGQVTESATVNADDQIGIVNLGNKIGYAHLKCVNGQRIFESKVIPTGIFCEYFIKRNILKINMTIQEVEPAENLIEKETKCVTISPKTNTVKKVIELNINDKEQKTFTLSNKYTLKVTIL